MKIFNKKPSDWKELEKMTADIFNNSGYKAVRNFSIDSVRSKKDIDVYVYPAKKLDAPILCECKHWNRPVSQEIVHSFRSVVNDYGAGLGLIISTSGFQSGAYEAAAYTNIKLVNWEEFLELHLEEWFIFKRRKLANIAKPLAVLTDPLDIPVEIFKGEFNGNTDFERYRDSIDKYYPILILLYTHKNPSENVIKDYNKYFNSNIKSYSDYFENLKSKTEEALKFYADLFAENNIDWTKFDFDMEEIINSVNYFLSNGKL